LNALSTSFSTWQFWAVGAPGFAAQTAIILVVLAAILTVTGQFQPPGSISGKTYLFLLLSGLATGASWVCYFRALKIGQASQVAPIDKLSVVLVALFGVIFLGEKLTLPNWLGVALIAVGAVLVAYRI
jgi:transporter family protein